jgi:hypothetical protein
MKQKLIVSIGNQLGNCLRIITSSLIIAEYYDLDVLIDMKNTYLQNKDRAVINALFGDKCSLEPPPYLKLDYIDCVSFNQFYGTNFHLICEGRFNKQTNSTFSISSNIYSVIPADMSEDEYVSRKIKLYKSLTLPSFLQNELNQHDLSEYIGVHIRHTDNLTDKAKQPLNTPLYVFHEKIAQLGDQKLLIVSDNQNILNNIPKKDTIIFANKCSNPLFQAFYEMCLLSKTKLIIGSNSSTFSYEASFLQGTDIELYEDNEWKLYKINNS